MGHAEDLEASPPASAADLMARVDVERLGRQRPAAFKSTWAEIGFCISILGSMLMAEFFISGFTLILPSVTESLSMPPGTQTWPASVFSLVTGSLLFPFGRLADMYGGRPLYFGGLAWFATWTLVAGFANDHVLLIVARAMQGLGPAAFLPSGVMLLGSTYRPGPRKNRVFSFYGSCAPVGFCLGIIVGGITAERVTWRWYFWLGSIAVFALALLSFFVIPPPEEPTEDEGEMKAVKMDWIGLATTVPGLLLFIFAITQGAHAPQGFATPYVHVTLVVGMLLLGVAFYVEGWVAEQPLLPFDLFKPKYMRSMCVCLFQMYGTYGIFQFYSSFYIQEIIGAAPLLASVWFIPMAVGGFILALVGAVALHRLPGHLLMIIASLGGMVSCLLFALIPHDANYWAWVFPAMIAATISVDIPYNVSSVFMTTALPRHRQGLAGALINSLVFVGIGFYLGLADLIVQSTKQTGDSSTETGFRVAFWFGVGCGGTALVVSTLFTRLGKAKSDLTVEERLELEEEGRRLQEQSALGQA